MKRAEILEAARACVCGERERDYGTPENNFETIGLLWGVYLRAAHPELAREHRRMREYYQMDDLYPERYKLKEKGIDVEKWQEEVLRDDP